MKTLLPRPAQSMGFTLIELLVVISIIAILAGFAVDPITKAMRNARQSNTVNNAHQLGVALKNYAMAHDGAFPAYADADNPVSKLADSNAAMEALMPKFCGDKAVLYNGTSKWCSQKNAPTPQTRYKVMAGENDWSYVRGLSDTSDSSWPLLATAFAPGTTKYVKDPSKPGGVWLADSAVVLRVDGAVKVMLCKEDGETGFVRRPDKPTKNMFEKDEDWLSGEDVEVLSPVTF